jgi:hypothetical protein
MDINVVRTYERCTVLGLGSFHADCHILALNHKNLDSDHRSSQPSLFYIFSLFPTSPPSATSHVYPILRARHNMFTGEPSLPLDPIQQQQRHNGINLNNPNNSHARLARPPKPSRHPRHRSPASARPRTLPLLRQMVQTAPTLPQGRITLRFQEQQHRRQQQQQQRQRQPLSLSLWNPRQSRGTDISSANDESIATRQRRCRCR